MNVIEWLRGLGLEQYGPAFRDNDIDGKILRRLTAEDLRELGIASIGHRRRLLDAIGALGEGVEAAEPARTALAQAERRQLTVLFCDLVGSTPLSTQLDPEDLGEIGAADNSIASDVIRDAGGFVAEYMGDGCWSISATRWLTRMMPSGSSGCAGLNRQCRSARRLDVKSVKLQARFGIATGLVVVGDLIGEGSAQEQSVVGETPNLAARLQALAKPDAVVNSEALRKA
jgi:class 3 adenylate cyclase